MEVIIALLMFNCNLHLNFDWCVKKHESCVDTLASIKQTESTGLSTKLGGAYASLSYSQKLAVSYLYCVETGGVIRPDINLDNILDVLQSSKINLENN